MIRTQIQLSEEQVQALKQQAARQDTSMAEVIRQAIDQWLRSAAKLDREESKRRALAAAGRFHSGHADLSSEHDRHLVEAYDG